MTETETDDERKGRHKDDNNILGKDLETTWR